MMLLGDTELENRGDTVYRHLTSRRIDIRGEESNKLQLQLQTPDSSIIVCLESISCTYSGQSVSPPIDLTVSDFHSIGVSIECS